MKLSKPTCQMSQSVTVTTGWDEWHIGLLSSLSLMDGFKWGQNIPVVTITCIFCPHLKPLYFRLQSKPRLQCLMVHDWRMDYLIWSMTMRSRRLILWEIMLMRTRPGAMLSSTWIQASLNSSLASLVDLERMTWIMSTQSSAMMSLSLVRLYLKQHQHYRLPSE